jgi:hypothetical protein
MRTTTKNVLIETTTRQYGMLVQGGISGRVVAYPLEDACRVTGLTKEQIKAATETSKLDSFGLSVRDTIEHWLWQKGRVIRRGHKIY